MSKEVSQILLDLKRKIFRPVYFLSGEETFYIDQVSDYIEENALDEAEREFNQIVEELPQSDAAPEALYWAGVARYKSTGDASALADTAAGFKQRYQQSTWAKKASVWAA